MMQLEFLEYALEQFIVLNSHPFLTGGCLLFVASSQFWLQTYEAQIDGIKVFGIKPGYEDTVA